MSEVQDAMRKLAEGQRLQAEALAELAREIETAKQAAEWVSQRDSPLGSRAHRELARAGAFPSSRVGKLVLVRRADIDAYIARHHVRPRVTVDGAPKDTSPEQDLDDQLERAATRAKSRRAP